MPQPPFDTLVGHLLSNRQYKYIDQAKRDVLNVLNFYKTLTPKLEPFVFNNGQKQDLVCLSGTIPVPFKGVMYNIPVCIWLMDTHPYSSPICYVKPTSDMEIKMSRHVDSSGRIYMPYLHEWNHSSSDLLGLIQLMIIVFGELPPVFAKPKNVAGVSYNTPYPAQQTGGLPYPSYPSSGPTSYPSSTGPTPYPNATNFNNYPGYPPTSGSTQGGYYPGGSGAFPGYPPAGSTPYPSYPSQSSTTSPVGSSQPVNSQANSAFNMSTISDEHMRISLLSAVEDKLKKKLKEVLSQSQAEMEVLKNTEEELNSGKIKLESILVKVDQEQMELESVIRTLNDKNEEMSDLLTRMEGQDNVEIDDTIDTTSPLYRQLLNAFAEESATEDAIYYTSEALRKGVIDMDIFLKNIRELSRKQFELRALMQKCRLKAGLP